MKRGLALLALTALALTGCSLYPDIGFDLPAEAPATSETGAVEIPANATAATVNYVHDGDTLFLSTATDPNLKVRLTGIDTPEVGDKLECYGDEATELLRTLLPEGTAVLASADTEPLDQYGRSLLYLFTENGTFINLEMIAQGAAEELHYDPNVAYVDRFSAEESAAKSSMVGMWGAC